MDSDPRIESYPDLDVLTQPRPESISLTRADAEDYSLILRFETELGESVGLLLPPVQLEEMTEEFADADDEVKRLEMEIRRHELEGTADADLTYSEKKRGASQPE